MTNALPQPPRKLGKYEIVEKIGEGGYSCVYRGFDPLIKRHVAIKSCSTSHRELRERFYREAEIAGNLDHSNIVRVYDLFLEQETPYLVQELLEGEDLDDVIERRDLSSLTERLFLLIQIVRGLDYAHQRGVIHRDVKPANIRVLDDGTIKILDFGIAQLVHYNSDLTQQGMAVGTAAYLAPEQIRGEKASPATDIFSFGVLAYELLTYVRPFGRDTISETFFQTLNHDPAPLTAHWADCPAELVEIIRRCLKKDPEQRFGSCADVLRELEAVRDRMAAERSPQANPARTQLLPATVDLPLGTSVEAQPAPAGQHEALSTRSLPIQAALTEPNPAHVDLPLRERPLGMRIAGTARRRRRPYRWLPVPIALALAVAAWLWLPGTELLERAEGWVDQLTVKAMPSASGPPATAAPETAVQPSAAAIERPAPEGDSTEASVIDEPAEAVEPVVTAESTVAAAPSDPQPAPEPGPATISFDGVWSPGIQLSVDGAPPVALGRARVVPIEPGDHSLTFSLDSEGFRDSQTLRVRVAPNESKRIPVPIAPPGRLTVQAHLGSPQGLVRIDGRRLLRPTPLRNQPIKPGTHRIALFSHDDRSRPLLESTVEVRSGHEAIVTFDLEGSRQPHVREKRIRR